jgi:SEC-C motif-containing protein
LPHFAMQPRPLSTHGDQLFYEALKQAGLKPSIVQKRTVNYHCLYKSMYDALKETPPPNARPMHDVSLIYRWVDKLTPRERMIVSRRTGVSFTRATETEGASDSLKTGRNQLCPCGSGRKFKRCHGQLTGNAAQ